jgi:hypothetical protein
MRCDCSGYGWEAVLYEELEARGFRTKVDHVHHITWKELRAVRLTVISFMSLPRGRKVPMHKGNQAMMAVYSYLTS